MAIKITFPMICHADLIRFSRAAASVACCGRDCREIEDVRDGRSVEEVGDRDASTSKDSLLFRNDVFFYFCIVKLCEIGQSFVISLAATCLLS